jgi:hypothetical protein
VAAKVTLESIFAKLFLGFIEINIKEIKR